MKQILLLNANTSTDVTERMRLRSQQIADDQAIINAATPTFGPAIIASRAENAIATHAVLDAAARHRMENDGVLLAVSMDTGLSALREMLDIPVVGMTEAAVVSACMLGEQIGFLTLGPQMLPMYKEAVGAYGLDSRIAAWRALTLPSAYAATDLTDESVAHALTEACEELVEREGVDVIILSGAVLTGYVSRLTPHVSVPLVDAIDAATVQLLAMLRLKGNSRLGRPSRPTGRVVHGVSPELTSWLGPPSSQKNDNSS